MEEARTKRRKTANGPTAEEHQGVTGAKQRSVEMMPEWLLLLKTGAESECGSPVRFFQPDGCCKTSIVVYNLSTERNNQK